MINIVLPIQNGYRKMDGFCTVFHTEDGKILGVQFPEVINSPEVFIELLQFLEGKAEYFERYELVLAVPIDFSIASLLSHETNLNKIIDTYSFLRMMIKEDFPNLTDGRLNRLLNQLCKRHTVWLGNLGSGTRTNLVAVMEGCFEGLVLDNGFSTINRDKAISPIVIREMRKYTKHMIVPGVNTGMYQPIRLRHVEKII